MSSTQIQGIEVTVGCPSPSSSSSEEELKSFQFHFHDFANLLRTGSRDHYVASPKFTCNGHQWGVAVYPGGSIEAEEGQVSVFLIHFSEGTITIRYNIKIIDKFGKTKADEKTTETKQVFNGGASWGTHNFISRSVILDKSQNILDSKGTLTVIVSMEEEPTTVFVPKNPLVKMVKDKFNDQNTADVCFEVGSADKKKGKKKKSKTSVSFFAHRLILEMCAPMLATICESNDSGGRVTASVDDIKPQIFHYLLSYVYGRTIPKEALKNHAKDIIDAANKYSIVNLKLTAEAAYVESTDINLDNAMDNLQYADSKNLALLKEAVMNFLAENHHEAAAHISFSDFPGHIVKDLLIAFGSYSKKGPSGSNVDELTTLSVSALRRKLDKMGEDVDGSREAMIEEIKRKSHS